MGRAGNHTGGRVRTVNAARRLEHGALDAEFDDDFIKVTGTNMGWTEIEITEDGRGMIQR